MARTEENITLKLQVAELEKQIKELKEDKLAINQPSQSATYAEKAKLNPKPGQSTKIP